MRIVMVSKDGCVPCSIVKPMFEQLYDNTNHNFDYLNITNNQDNMDFAIEHKVLSVPTFIIFDKEEKEVKRYMGLKGFNEMKIDYSLS